MFYILYESIINKLYTTCLMVNFAFSNGYEDCDNISVEIPRDKTAVRVYIK